MVEADNSGPSEKREICGAAVASVGLAILALAVGLWPQLVAGITCPPSNSTEFIGFTVLGLGLGIWGAHQIKKSEGRLRGRALLILGIAGNSLLLSLYVVAARHEYARRRALPAKICRSNLHQLGLALYIYQDEHENAYPQADKWCDSILKRYPDLDQRVFVCPGALAHGDQGRCHYAINPDAGPNSPGDVVLLFETGGAWNQNGGPELLAQDHHKRGCNILFNDLSIRFVPAAQVGKLKWGHGKER
jgi:hypothetical protein